MPQAAHMCCLEFFMKTVKYTITEPERKVNIKRKASMISQTEQERLLSVSARHTRLAL